ncbi:hypothetical protein [Arthrobacter russicus]|uniref:Uncharacterized protein n=1 Tax=Arthrobacter russicus TaxID=172040 RepID=A0ABU1JET3_9MICC|nr:hypothetical protein [Arthrobacter russicus]MDR6270640.1 hypothetical protein [Arthrobacter russicus]
MPKHTRLSRHGHGLNPLRLTGSDLGKQITATGFIGTEGDNPANIPWGSITGTLDRYTFAESSKNYGTILYLVVSSVPVTLIRVEP